MPNVRNSTNNRKKKKKSNSIDPTMAAVNAAASAAAKAVNTATRQANTTKKGSATTIGAPAGTKTARVTKTTSTRSQPANNNYDNTLADAPILPKPKKVEIPSIFDYLPSPKPTSAQPQKSDIDSALRTSPLDHLTAAIDNINKNNAQNKEKAENAKNEPKKDESEDILKELLADEDNIVANGQQAAAAIASGFDTPENRAAVKAYEDLQARRSGETPQPQIGYSSTKTYVEGKKSGMSQEEINATVEKGKKAGDYTPYLTAEGVEKNVVTHDNIGLDDLNDIYILRGLGEDERAENARNEFEKAKSATDSKEAQEDREIRGYIASGESLVSSGYKPPQSEGELRKVKNDAKQAMANAEQNVSRLYHSGASEVELAAARKAYALAEQEYRQANYAYNAAYNYTEYTQNEAAKKEFDKVRANTDFLRVVEQEKEKNEDLPIPVVGIAGTPIYSGYYKEQLLEAANQEIINTAYYIRATQGEEAAREYLDLYSSELEQSLSEKWLVELDDMGEGFSQGAHKRGYDAAAGFNKFITGIGNVGAYANDDIPLLEQNAIERSQQTLAQGYEGGEKLASDLIYNTSNMAPSLAAAFIPGIGQAAGLTLLGTSTLGSTYADTRREGYSPEEARLYAAANAGSEVFMQYALGGITKLGASGGMASKLTTAAERIAKNPTAARGLAILGNMTSEGAEEYLQENLDPILRNAILGEVNEINPFSEDKWYAALLGSLTALGMNAPTDVANIVQQRSATKAANAKVDSAYVQNSLQAEFNNPITETIVTLETAPIKADEILANAKNVPVESVQETRTARETADAIINKNTHLEVGQRTANLQKSKNASPEWQTYVAQAEAIHPQAIQAQNELVNNLSAVFKDDGFTVLNPGAKGIESTADKIFRKANDGNDYTINSIKDHTRASVRMNDLSDTANVVKKIKNAYPNVKGEVLRSQYGYVGYHLTVQGKNGINSEIQLVTPESYRIKVLSDGIYQKWRNVPEESKTRKQKLQEKKDLAYSKKLWDDYYAGFTPEVIDIASSSVNGLDSIQEPVNPLNGFHSASENTNVSNTLGDGTRASNVPPSVNPYSTSDSIFNAPPIKNNIPQESGSVKGDSVDSRARLNDLGKEYGTIKPGENPTRESSLPKQTSKDQYLSQYARTLYEAGQTTPDMIPALESKIEQGDFSHERITNKSLLEKIETRFEQKGVKSLESVWDGVIEGTGYASAQDIATGQYLYNNYVQNGEYTKAIKIAAELSVEATRAGQAVQAFRVLKKLTPDGQLYAMERVKNKINGELLNRLGKNAPDIKIDDNLARALLEAKTPAEVETAAEAIKQNIADQMPATWVDKVNAWRYLSMLGNPKTHIRNIVGNAIFVPIRQFKNLIGAGIEKVAGVKKAEKTKSVINPIKDQQYIDAGKKSFDDVKDIMRGTDKYGMSDILERRTIFKTKWLEWTRKQNFRLLELEDVIFMKSAYVNSYAQAMKARGLDAKTLTKAQDVSISEYAMSEALKATYRDYNALAGALNRFKKSGKVQSLLGEGLFPFTTTPLNVLKRGVEYSPIGLAKGVYEVFHDVRAGKKTATQAIDTISSGLSGTGVMALGAFLAAQGILVGDSGDKDENALLRLTGGQNYALEIGGKSYTIDWAAPVALPLFVGVELHNTAKTGNPEASFKNIIDSLTKISDPLFNLSMLQSVNSAIESAKYSDGNAFSNIMINVATSYAGQFVPTVLGQFARIVDENVRKTYYGSSDLPKAVDSLWQGVIKKIPGASQLLEPSIDRWGREIKSGSTAERVIENLISPGYYSERNITKVDEEIDRLYKQIGDSAVIPPLAPKYITVDGQRVDFSASEYTKMSKELGTTAFNAAESTISSPEYAKLSDREKAVAIGEAYNYAMQTAKASMGKGYQPDKWVTELSTNGINKGLYFSVRARSQGIENDRDAEGVTIKDTGSLKKKDIIDSTGAAQNVKNKLYEMFGVSKNVRDGSVTWSSIEKTQAATDSTIIPEAVGYKVSNLKTTTLEKIAAYSISREDYAYVNDRMGAHKDKVQYLQELGFQGSQLNGMVDLLVMGSTAHDKMTVAEEDMNIPNDVYIETYITGYSSVGSKAERNQQIRNYVDGLPGLSQEQKDALYEWNKVSKGKSGDGSSSGSSGGGRRSSGRRSSGKKKTNSAKGADVPTLPDLPWNILKAAMKSTTAKAKATTPEYNLAVAANKIRSRALEEELAGIEDNSALTAAMKTAMKKEIRQRYRS